MENIFRCLNLCILILLLNYPIQSYVFIPYLFLLMQEFCKNSVLFKGSPMLWYQVHMAEVLRERWKMALCKSCFNHFLRYPDSEITRRQGKDQDMLIQQLLRAVQTPKATGMHILHVVTWSISRFDLLRKECIQNWVLIVCYKVLTHLLLGFFVVGGWLWVFFFQF